MLNDCIGFAGPLALLLNKLFRFLQQGSGHLDGYVHAMSLGVTEGIEKSRKPHLIFFFFSLFICML